jgi:abortive infection bacteriophage resistance protein
MDALERIEVAIRSQVAYQVGSHDPIAYVKPDLLHETFTSFAVSGALSKHHIWLTKQAGLLSRSKEDFMQHHRDMSKLPVPIWVACEVWDFGAMSQLYDGMSEADQDAISTQYGVQNGRIFATWLRSLNYLRNVCAHHCRLWNRNMVDTPTLPPASSISWVEYFDQNPHTKTRVFLSLHICAHIMKTINPTSTWNNRMAAHLNTIPDLSSHGFGLGNMGIMGNWADFWH